VLLADHPVPDWLSLGVWRESVWIKVFAWAPFYAGTIMTLYRDRRSTTPGPY
jgi:hypothetical protein